MYPTNIYYMPNYQYTLNANELFIEEWGQVAQFTQDDEASMRRSAYYATRVQSGLIAIAYNTNYM